MTNNTLTEEEKAELAASVNIDCACSTVSLYMDDV